MAAVHRHRRQDLRRPHQGCPVLLHRPLQHQGSWPSRSAISALPTARFPPAVLLQILSGSRDKTIKLWNVVGKCIYTLSEDGHTDWVSCVRCSPAEDSDIVVSAGWDKLVKVWNLKTSRLQTDLVGHTGYLNTVTVSPDGSLCASGGKDGIAMLWDLNEGKKLYELVAGDEINTLVFSPNRYWLCAATKKGIKIYDLETKSVVADLELEEEETTSKDALVPFCTSLAWSADGSTLFAGYTDKLIRVWGL